MHDPAAVWGYALGCAIANFNSPLGIIDVVVGTMANLITGLFAYKFKNMLAVVTVCPVIIGIIVGAELSVFYGAPFLITAACVALGELAVLSVSAIIYRLFRKRL